MIVKRLTQLLTVFRLPQRYISGLMYFYIKCNVVRWLIQNVLRQR